MLPHAHSPEVDASTKPGSLGICCKVTKVKVRNVGYSASNGRVLLAEQPAAGIAPAETSCQRHLPRLGGAS